MWRGALAFITAGCAAAGSQSSIDNGSDGNRIGSSLADDVVRVGGFGHVGALAMSRTRTYVVGDGGIAIYDRLGQRWLVPVPLAMNAPRLAAVPTLAAADPATDALWVAVGSRIWVVRPATRFFTSVPLPADARELLVDRVGRGAYVFANGWWAVSSSGSAMPLPAGQSPPRDDAIAIPDAQQVLRETPGLQSFGGLLTRDARLRTWPLTSLARAPERNEVWAGTNGGGAFVVDPAFMRSTQMPYGVRSRGATAVALAADGVWIAEEPDALSAPDLNITFASNDLTAWRWLSPMRGTLGVVAMAVREHWACLATNAGAVVVDLEAPQLPEPRVLELTSLGRLLSAWATSNSCWIGGTTGIAQIAWPTNLTMNAGAVSDGRATFAFASSGDTVWAATQAGVEVYLDGKLSPEVTPGPSEATAPALPNALLGPIRGIALAGDGLALLTDRELWLTSGARRLSDATRVDGPLERLGRIRRIVADDRTLWLGGTRGAAAFSLRDRRWTFVNLSDPGIGPSLGSADPSDVRDLALSPGVAWLATGAGVVRVARGDDGMPR
jgi:hypothetical protein